MKKIIIIVLLVLGCQSLFSQITKVTIGINGLTCSQCSRSVAIKLEQDEQVKSVEMDLQDTYAYVILKDKNKIDFNQLVKDVKSAGFSVRSIDVAYSFHTPPPKNDNIKIGNNTIYLNKNIPEDKQEISFRLVGKTYNANKKENKQLKSFKQINSGNENDYFAILK